MVIARGKARQRQASDETEIGDVLGPSGNVRAPLVRVGDTLIVGFAPEVLAELLG